MTTQETPFICVSSGPRLCLVIHVSFARHKVYLLHYDPIPSVGHAEPQRIACNQLLHRFIVATRPQTSECQVGVSIASHAVKVCGSPCQVKGRAVAASEDSAVIWKAQLKSLQTCKGEGANASCPKHRCAHGEKVGSDQATPH